MIFRHTLFFVLFVSLSAAAQDATQPKLPNIISPNGDGLNDSFYIGEFTLENAPKMVVVNRWGKTIFEAKRYINQWDARETENGTYFYTISYDDGQEIAGWLQIVK